VIDLTGDGTEAGAVLVRRVSHAVMNDLAVVRLLLDSANGQALSPDASAALDKASTLVGDVADMLGQLSALARPGRGEVDADLRDVVGRIGHLLDVVAGPAARVRVVLPDEPVVASVDPRRAQQELLADVAALGGVAEPGTTITVGIEGGALAVAAGDVAIHT
jgi:two-component sensor histidine kinase